MEAYHFRCFCAEDTTLSSVLRESATEKKGDNIMKVEYNGFTGELVKLERQFDEFHSIVYDLSIKDREKHVVHSFTGVKLSDVKFLGGAVTFDG